MPTLSVFFRKDDVEKWKAIPNKSQFLHDVLESNISKQSRFIPAMAVSDVEPLIPVFPRRPQDNLCKEHGVPLDSRGKCLQRGCKYA